MRFTSVALSLLGLAAGPLSSLVDARAIGNASPALASRSIEFEWDDKPKVKISDLGLSLNDKKRFTPSTDEQKKIYSGDWFVTTRDEDDGLEAELECLKKIDGQDIAPPVVALVIEDDDDDKVVGMASYFLDGAQPTADDLDAATALIEKVHAAGFAHRDPHKGNFKKVGDKLWLIDFDSAKKDPSDKEKAADIKSLRYQIAGIDDDAEAGGNEEEGGGVTDVIGDIIDTIIP